MLKTNPGLQNIDQLPKMISLAMPESTSIWTQPFTLITPVAPDEPDDCPICQTAMVGTAPNSEKRFAETTTTAASPELRLKSKSADTTDGAASERSFPTPSKLRSQALSTPTFGSPASCEPSSQTPCGPGKQCSGPEDPPEPKEAEMEEDDMPVIRTHACAHVFHRACLSAWLRTRDAAGQYVMTCPMCRARLYEEGRHFKLRAADCRLDAVLAQLRRTDAIGEDVDGELLGGLRRDVDVWLRGGDGAWTDVETLAEELVMFVYARLRASLGDHQVVEIEGIMKGWGMRLSQAVICDFWKRPRGGRRRRV